MYCYLPEKRCGEDKVAWINGVQGTVGDLVRVDDMVALILGETITNAERGNREFVIVRTELLIPWLLSVRTIEFLHQFVGERFTSYAAALPLWIGADLQTLQKRAKKKSPQTSRARSLHLHPTWWFVFAPTAATTVQQMLVFPDIWTMHQQLPMRLFDQPWVARWHGWLSAGQQAAIFWWCKTGEIHMLITTPAGIFQDRSDLQEICVVDAHKRRYKSAQEPRYRTPSVLSAIKNVYSCRLTSSWVLLSSW